MKKILVIIALFATCSLTTACINSFAIQELNQIGKNYMDKGDYKAAISRFQSSVDLDENIFDSRYNLGVAYIKDENYEAALSELEAAMKLKPDSPDAVYSYAVALEGMGLAFEDKEEEVDKIEIAESLQYVDKAIDYFEKYLNLNPDKQDAEEVSRHIKQLQSTIEEYKKQFETEQ